MIHRVIGTAGHVDHGKSTLVKRLTGIDPDRLIEEKKRQLTIDLGFAWLNLGDDKTVGIVDVPGHRDFIENMLAGVGSIDAVVLVIAADEGLMPQTKEHLAILDILGLEHGLIALSKTDLIQDAEWIDLVEEEIREIIQNTGLRDAPIVRLSAFSGDGIPEFQSTLDTLLSTLPPNQNRGQPRLSIDRVFSISGFGTVVTGTLLGNSLSIGDTVEIQPGGLMGRIRGLQSYEQSVDKAFPGSRVAINITGIDKKDVQRGNMLSLPGVITPTVLVDVYYRHLADASRDLQHNAEVKVFSSAAETVANVRLLDQEILNPGDEGWLQLRLTDPLPLSRGDRYILRFPSPPETIGGGIIVNPNPGRRHKRFQQGVIDHLSLLSQGTPLELITNAVMTTPLTLAQVSTAVGFDIDTSRQAIGEALEKGTIISVGKDRYFATQSLIQLQESALQLATEYHVANPLRSGIPKEELRTRLNINTDLLDAIINAVDELISQQDVIRLNSHKIRFTDKQLASIEDLFRSFQQTPFTPPSFKEAVDVVSEPVLRALIELDEIVQVQADVIFERSVYDHMVSEVIEILKREQSIDAKTLRDHFDTSRKYAIALLEHLDAIGITRRQGDTRILGKPQ